MLLMLPKYAKSTKELQIIRSITYIPTYNMINDFANSFRVKG